MTDTTRTLLAIIRVSHHRLPNGSSGYLSPKSTSRVYLLNYSNEVHPPSRHTSNWPTSPIPTAPSDASVDASRRPPRRFNPRHHNANLPPQTLLQVAPPDRLSCGTPGQRLRFDKVPSAYDVCCPFAHKRRTSGLSMTPMWGGGVYVRLRRADSHLRSVYPLTLTLMPPH